MHVLARPEIVGIDGLAGRKVNVDVRGSGTAMTASLVFEALGISAELVNDAQDVALEKLRRGEIAALAYVPGQPVRLFSTIVPGSGLHFLPVPVTPALLSPYLPSNLGHDRYPTLVPQDGAVEALAVGAVMAVDAWQRGTERFRKVAGFVQAFVSRAENFIQPPRKSKRGEVNLAAQVPGWVRFDAAQEPRPEAMRRRS